jgi:ubiquinone/menaquinone biosynthesis C-methylase UbiE
MDYGELIKAEIKQHYELKAEALEQQTALNPYENISGPLRRFRQRKLQVALELAQFPAGAKILEVGTEQGQYAVALAARGFRVTGIELSPRMTKLARRNADSLGIRNVEYLEADVERLELFGNSVFDGVVSFSALRYVPDLDKAFAEIRRVTRSGGSVVLDFPNRYCPWFKVLKHYFGVADHIHDHTFRARDIRRRLKGAGFSQVETLTLLFTHYTFAPRLLRLYEIIDAVGEATPGLRQLAAIIMCKGVAS